MSVFSALYTGVTGMTALGKNMEVLGNNIANVNTIGYKGSRMEFSDLLYQSINSTSGRQQVGRGVRMEAIQGLFHQGSFESTPIVTDVAINGNGYFVLSNGQKDYFTRNGQFRIDTEGDLVNSMGLNVNGLTFGLDGEVMGDRGPINLSSITSPPNPTGDGTDEGSGISLNINLHPTEANPETDGIMEFDITDPNDTSNFSTAVTLYDSLGGAHTSLVYFNKTGENQWEWHALVDGSEITDGTTGEFVEAANGTLTFDATGNLTTQTTENSEFNFVGGAQQGQTIGFDFTGSTQTYASSVTNFFTQDGFPPGNLTAIDIDQDGIITGVFSNGLSRDVAQLSVASFPAEHGLERKGNNLFTQTAESGQAIYATANVGTHGSISGSTLELSNVELTEQFVKLITTQRGFQANTKVVTTGDEMLETVIQMKR